ncbi:hypothetical protein, partial [Klebsiella pneumoniae]|uniref:hypothetical protein n=6 Tax=Klebsiella pneumoniae TaxID=573 RepID=UPI001A930583
LFSVFTGQIMINHSQFCFRGILWFSHKIAPYSVGCPTFGVQSSSATGHHQCTTGQKYHQNHNKRLYSRFQPAIRYFVTSSIAFFYR